MDVARFTGNSDQCGITERSGEGIKDFFCQLWWTFQKMHTLQLFMVLVTKNQGNITLVFFPAAVLMAVVPTLPTITAAVL